jgi:hypothetical protein
MSLTAAIAGEAHIDGYYSGGLWPRFQAPSKVWHEENVLGTQTLAPKTAQKVEPLRLAVEPPTVLSGDNFPDESGSFQTHDPSEALTSTDSTWEQSFQPEASQQCGFPNFCPWPSKLPTRPLKAGEILRPSHNQFTNGGKAKSRFSFTINQSLASMTSLLSPKLSDLQRFVERIWC